MKREKIIGSSPVFFWGHAAVRRDNKEVYLTDTGDDGAFNRPPVKNINIFSKTENTVIDTVYIGSPTGSIFLSPKERYAFVNRRGIELVVIDLKYREVVIEHDYEGEFRTALERIHISNNRIPNE